MLVKYVGTRPFLSVVLSGRGQYYFGSENGFTVEVDNMPHVNELLRSTQHKFEITTELPPEKPKEKPPKEKVEVKEEKPKKKKRGRRKKNA